MANEFLVTTTGTLSPVVIADLGNRTFVHPTVSLDLYLEYQPDEISESVSLQDAIDNGYITVVDELGAPVTEVGISSDPGMQATEHVVDPLVTDDGFKVGDVWINTVLGTSWIIRDNTPGAAIWDQIAPSAAPAAAWTEDQFTATLGQISFILSTAPTDAASVEMDVNGVNYEGNGADYTRSGVTITWLNTLFSMAAGDNVLVRYR